ncbi:hypothetical protein C1H46_004888 [Malus baccata]|uniref:RING-type domain-containing protein n=1 Tax=Malus baccata TaxID=106549 RepID=A0A540NG90_MALBA|nr:hypothetical protein C1H46_004888 [Malus baccata]
MYSCSRRSFPDDFDDTEFPCPFDVDDDDVIDPGSRVAVKSLRIQFENLNEDVCPTYLDEYTKKIQKSNDMSCPHHFQLGCNNEWLAKNERWPICGRWKDLVESDVYDENRRVATMLEVANAKSCSWFNPKKG